MVIAVFQFVIILFNFFVLKHLSNISVAISAKITINLNIQQVDARFKTVSAFKICDLEKINEKSKILHFKISITMTFLFIKNQKIVLKESKVGDYFSSSTNIKV